MSASPQVSFNFGIGTRLELSERRHRTIGLVHLPEAGLEPSAADVELLQTINYGGGARWFIKNHLAFSFDVRFYEIQPGTPIPPLPGSPRTRLFIIAAGISLK